MPETQLAPTLNSPAQASPAHKAASPQELLRSAERFAEDLAARPATGDTSAPLADLKTMADLGLLTAPLPTSRGGLGLGTEPGSHLTLLRLLSIVGGADLVLGRLYEGHVNALILIATYGSETQLRQAADDARAGRLFGVWNTGSPELLRLDETSPGRFTLQGNKTFASGAAFVQRPIVTAQLGDRGWQMTLPRMDDPEVAAQLGIDRTFWLPLGMEASESFAVDFTGVILGQQDLIGAPGDYYRDPLFRGGAIRFAAAHAGAILRLHRLFAEWLGHNRRGDDPYQIARLGDIALNAQAAVLWIERSAAIAEEALAPNTTKLASEHMVDTANMARLAVERLALSTMQLVTTGVGAHGLLRPHRFERILRNLTMYLRQPSPDRTLADVGRESLRRSHLRAGGANGGLWHQAPGDGTLPPSYFDSVYANSPDPWNFETSDYEAAKYRHTLESLPRPRYGAALEIGCSIGVLTRQLAERCDHLLSVDVSDRALAAARERCNDLPQAEFQRLEIPAQMPDGQFDLVVISEVAYYWQRGDLDRAATLLAARQPAGAHLILVHFTPLVPDYPLTGDQVHEAWLARPEWKHLHGDRRERYRLDVLERV